MECKGNNFFYLTTNSLQNNEIDPNKYTKKRTFGTISMCPLNNQASHA